MPRWPPFKEQLIVSNAALLWSPHARPPSLPRTAGCQLSGGWQLPRAGSFGFASVPSWPGGACTAGAWQLQRVTMTSRLSGAQAGIPGETGSMVNRAHGAEPSPLLPTVPGFEGSFHDARAPRRSSPQRRSGSGLSLPHWAPFGSQSSGLVTLWLPGHGELLLIEGLCRSPHQPGKPAISRR